MNQSARGASVERKPLVGIALKVLSVASFMLMNSFIKAAGQVPAGQIVFYRSFFALVPVFALLAWQRELGLSSFYTKRPLSHFWRGFVGVCSMSLGFFALTRLPLPDAVTLGYAQPLIVVVLSAVVLGETVRIYRWSAVVVGFIGVVIIAWPNLSLIRGHGLAADQVLGVLAAIASAGSSAVAMMLVRRLVSTEKTSTIVIWFFINASILSLMTMPFGWVDLSVTQLSWLILAGFWGGVGQMLMTHSYRFAELSTIAPFEYTSIIMAIVIGYFVFGDTPTVYMLTGGAIVVGAGLFIIWREQKVGAQIAPARKVERQGGV